MFQYTAIMWYREQNLYRNLPDFQIDHIYRLAFLQGFLQMVTFSCV